MRLAYTCCLLAACAPSATLIAKPARPKDCDVRIFSQEAHVSAPFERVCIIRGAPDEAVSEELALQSVRQQACECGADAVLLSAPERLRSKAAGYGIAFESSAAMTVRER